jgi:hypothetical protein
MALATPRGDAILASGAIETEECAHALMVQYRLGGRRHNYRNAAGILNRITWNCRGMKGCAGRIEAIRDFQASADAEIWKISVMHDHSAGCPGRVPIRESRKAVSCALAGTEQMTARQAAEHAGKLLSHHLDPRAIKRHRRVRAKADAAGDVKRLAAYAAECAKAGVRHIFRQHDPTTKRVSLAVLAPGVEAFLQSKFFRKTVQSDTTFTALNFDGECRRRKRSRARKWCAPGSVI